jgi:hypothetical protein
MGYAIGVLVVLVAIYAGSYYATVERRIHHDFTELGPSGPATIGLVPSYSIGGDISASLFLPIHQIDQKLRSRYWSIVEAVRAEDEK